MEIYKEDSEGKISNDQELVQSVQSLTLNYQKLRYRDNVE